jgi:hypothetical protein
MTGGDLQLCDVAAALHKSILSAVDLEHAWGSSCAPVRDVRWRKSRSTSCCIRRKSTRAGLPARQVDGPSDLSGLLRFLARMPLVQPSPLVVLPR